jgi:hypothetical protein
MTDKQDDGDWVSTSITVAICMLTALANPWISMSVAFAAMVFLAFYYWRRYGNRTGSALAAAGAGVLLATIVVLWLVKRH